MKFTILGEEPVYFFFQRVVRPLLYALSALHKRFEFAIYRMADDIVQRHDGPYISRPSPEQMAQWAHPNAAYNKVDLDAGIPMEKRLAGQILPLLEPLIEKDEVKTVVDVGSGNGALLEYLAAKYPTKQFIGVDFWTPESKLANLKYVRGYAYDVMPAANLVFTNFTAVKFYPIEIANYFERWWKLGVKYVVMSEPTRLGHQLSIDKPPKSHDYFPVYLDGRLWRHNYYFVAAGKFKILHYKTEWLRKRLPGHRARWDTCLFQMVAQHNPHAMAERSVKVVDGERVEVVGDHP
jgi:hypothetical protein